MLKRAIIMSLFISIFSAAFVCADVPEKELEKNWDMVMTAYRAAPAAKDTTDKLDAFIARWKDSNKYEAARAQYLKGITLFHDGKYSAAYTQFQALLDQFSSTTFCDSAMYMMGECQYNTGKFADAIDTWSQFRFKYAESMFGMEAVYGTSLAWLSLKEYKKAEQALSGFLERNQYFAEDDNIKLIGGIIDYYLMNYDGAVDRLKRLRSDVSYYYLGQSYLKMTPGKFMEAASSFKDITDGYKTSKYLESSLYNEAESFFKGLNYEQAANVYKELLDRFPNSNLAPYARLKRGSAYLNSKKPDLAIEEWSKAASGEGDKRVRAYAQYLEAEAYRQEKKYQLALTSYNKVMTQFPDVYEVVSSAQVKSGWCYLVLGDDAKAQDILTTFTTKFVTHTDLPLGYYLLGTSAYNKKDYGNALQAYKFLLDKFNYTELTEAALLMTELCYYNQGQDSMLITDASHMLEILEDKFQSPNPKIRSRAYYYLGLSYFKLGMYGPASQAFKRIVDYYYDSDIVTEARANLAWCYYEIENYRGARTMANDVVTNPTISKEVKMACEILVAHSYFSEKMYDKASSAYGEFAYNNAKAGNPELVAEALFQQGRVFEVQEFYNDAIKSWQACVSNYPKSKRAPEAMFKMADIFFKAQQYDKSLAAYQEIISRWPKSPEAEDAALSIGEVYYNSDQEAKAVKAYEDFMKKYPDSKKIKNVEEGMQRAAYKKGDKKNDPEMLLEFAGKYPESTMAVNALYRAAEIYYQANKTDKAIPVFNKVIEDFPNDTLAINAHYYLGACYEAEKKMDEAVAAYKAFLKNYPKHELASDVMFRLATAAYTAKSYDDAAFYYEMIIDKYVGTEYAQNAMYNVALVYTEQGKPDDAIKAYRRYAKEYPKDPKSKDIPLQIAGMYLEQKRYKEAITEYIKIAETGDESTKLESFYRAGEIYNTLEDADDAIITFSRMMDMKPKNSVYRVTGLIALATLYEGKQKFADAVDVYAQIADSGGEKQYVDGARSRMEEIKRVYPDLFKKGGETPAPKKADEGKKSK